MGYKAELLTQAKTYPYGKQTIRDGVAGDGGVRREGVGRGAGEGGKEGAGRGKQREGREGGKMQAGGRREGALTPAATVPQLALAFCSLPSPSLYCSTKFLQLVLTVCVVHTV